MKRAENVIIGNDNGFSFRKKVKKTVNSSEKVLEMQSIPESAIVGITSVDPMVTSQSNSETTLSTHRRRSSLGLRGKRVSNSMNGLCGLPHASVDTKTYYRHIDADQSEPVRMRQLLVWCAQKAMSMRQAPSNLPPEQRLLASKLISDMQQDIIQQIINKQINLSWYHRKPSENETDDSVVRIPHPQNVENQNKIDQYKKTMEQIDERMKIWSQIRKTLQNENDSFLDMCEAHRASLASLIQAHTSAAFSHDEIERTLKEMDVMDMEGLLSEEERRDLTRWCEIQTQSTASIDAMKFRSILTDRLQNMLLEIYTLNFTMKRQQSKVELEWKPFCDELFAELRRAYQEREAAQVNAFEPQELLRMLASSNVPVSTPE